MIYILFFLTITIGVMGYLIRIMNTKINLYEDFILERRKGYKDLLNRIKELDNKEIFEKDDEVGVTFLEIKTEIEEFDKFLE